MIDGPFGPKSLFLMAKVISHLSTRGPTVNLGFINAATLLRDLHNGLVNLRGANDVRFLEEFEISVLQAIESTFLTPRLVTAKDVLCVFQAAAIRQPSSADQLIPAALRAFRKKHSIQVSRCFTEPDGSGVAYVLDVASRLYEKFSLESTEQLEIVVATTQALNNIVKYNPHALVDHIGQREKSIVGALGQLQRTPSDTTAGRDMLQESALCWLRLAIAIPDSMPYAWNSLHVLLSEYSSNVLNSNWEEDDILHLISILPNQDKEPDRRLHAVGASFAADMLSITVGTPRISSSQAQTRLARCLQVLNTGMERRETRDIIKLFLKGCVPLLVNVLLQGPIEVKGAAVALISDLRSLDDDDRRLLMAIYGEVNSDGRGHIEKDSDAARAAAMSGQLFSQDPVDEVPSVLVSATTQMPGVTSYEFDDVRNLLEQQDNSSGVEQKDVLGSNTGGGDVRACSAKGHLVHTRTTQANIDTVIRISRLGRLRPSQLLLFKKIPHFPL